MKDWRAVGRVGSAVLCGVLCVLVVYGMRRASVHLFDYGQRQRLPSGWSIVRPPMDVGSIGIQGDTVWLGGRDGLFQVDRRSLVLRSVPEGGPVTGAVHGILVQGKDVWIGHDRGLARWDGARWEAREARRCRALLADRAGDRGGFWAGFDDGVGRWDGTRWEWLPRPPAEADVIYVDRDGSVWVGCASPSRGGLFRLVGGSWRSHGRDDGLPHAAVNAILRDRRGVMWVGTGFARQGGAARLEGERWVAVGTRDGLVGEKVRSIYQDERGRLWFGSEYDGVAIVGGERRVVITEAEGLAGRELKTVVRDDEGTWWLGTDGGLNRVAAGAMP